VGGAAVTPVPKIWGYHCPNGWAVIPPVILMWAVIKPMLGSDNLYSLLSRSREIKPR